MIYLTQSTTPIIGHIAWLLGKIMEGIFNVINFIGLPNIGLAIILFTIVMNLLMMPLTIKQQKFSKLSAKMNPELEAIRKKYAGRKDNDSVMAQNQETQAVYAKYGVSPTGSCAQLLIQMPILFALYNVIQAMPAYVSKIGNTFGVLADKILTVDKAAFLQDSGVETITRTVSMYGSKLLDESGNVLKTGVIDVLYKLSSTDMAVVAEHYGLSDLMYEGELILSSETTRGLIDTYNNFLGLNMGNSPSNTITTAFAAGNWLLIIGAVMIPVLSAVTQWINVKLMPSSNNDKKPVDRDTTSGQMESSMKTMNKIMPLMSAWFCFTLPAGLGLYWIAGSVVRSIQQIVINKYIDKLDFDQVIAKNSKKSQKKLEKLQAQQERLNAYAAMNTRNIQTKANVNTTQSSVNKTVNNSSNTANAVNHTADTASKNTGSKTSTSGSLRARANLVKEYNEKNNSKN